MFIFFLSLRIRGREELTELSPRNSVLETVLSQAVFGPSPRNITTIKRYEGGQEKTKRSSQIRKEMPQTPLESRRQLLTRAKPRGQMSGHVLLAVFPHVIGWGSPRVVREGVVAEKKSAKFPQTSRRISAPFPDAIKCILANFRKFSAESLQNFAQKTPSLTTPYEANC